MKNLQSSFLQDNRFRAKQIDYEKLKHHSRFTFKEELSIKKFKFKD